MTATIILAIVAALGFGLAARYHTRAIAAESRADSHARTLAVREETLAEVWQLYRDARDSERLALERLSDVAARSLGPMRDEQIPDPPSTRDADRALWKAMREEELRADGRLPIRTQDVDGPIVNMSPDPQGP